MIFVIQRDEDTGDFLYENKLAWEGIILKNRGTGMGASFGYHLSGEDWGYHPNWYRTGWSKDTVKIHRKD